MTQSLDKKVDYGENVILTEADGDATVYRMRDASGEGAMTFFHVLPGIDLLYNLSKFAAAIRDVMGVSPLKYPNTVV